ncbi:MAG: alpha/beta fold hydrolase [Candidatus Omnitrophica bacterium]|nr:alpha/beta fold hydrolase [Candidatus Omnitrophota bacterium]
MSVKFSFQLPKVQEQSGANPMSPGISMRGGNGVAVILVHGLTGTPNEMGFLANRLNTSGFSVLCPRLANHDRPLQVLKNTPWQDFYETVRQAYFKTREYSDTIFVSGLSMGALLGLLLAEEFSQSVAGVSCLSPTLFYDGWNCPWYRCFLPVVYWTRLHHFLYFEESPPYGIKNESLRRRVHDYFSKADAKNHSDIDRYGYPLFPVSQLRQLELLVKHLKPRLPKVTSPVQIIQAREDDMTSVRNAEFIYNRVSSKDKEMVLLNDSYHIITADQERGKVLDNMKNFFMRFSKQREPAHV